MCTLYFTQQIAHITINITYLNFRYAHLRQNLIRNVFISLLILVWPLKFRIPESLPTKVLNCVILCRPTVCVKMCTVLLPPGVYPIAVNRYIKHLYMTSLWMACRGRNMLEELHKIKKKNMSTCAIRWVKYCRVSLLRCMWIAFCVLKQFRECSY